jgi:hypothetical protein
VLGLEVMLFFFFENMAGPLPFIKKEDSKVQTEYSDPSRTEPAKETHT